MRETPASAPPLTWCRTFLATPDQVPEARRYLVAILGGHPATENATTCLSELAANAIQHSRSAGTGGTFTVRLRRSGPAIRIEVTDQGGPWRPPRPGSEYGRGLIIVRALASRRGTSTKGPADDPRERTAWFELAPG